LDTLTAKCKRPTKSFRPPLPIRNRRRLATKAAWPGGEIARGGAENGYATLVALTSGWRKVFCDGSKVDSAKVFASGGSGSDGQSAFANDGRFGSAATKRAAGMGDISVNSRWFCFSLKRFTFNIASVYG